MVPTDILPNSSSNSSMNTSTELLKVYRFQFKKREPILVAASSYIDALATLARSPYKVDDDESLECISIFNNLEILV